MELSVLANLYGHKSLDETLKILTSLGVHTVEIGAGGYPGKAHCNPAAALSDAKQQLTPAELDDLLYRQITVRDADSDAPEWKDNIDQLRAKIDVIDENLLYALNSRMKVSSQIGEYKKNNNIAIIQTARWDAVMAKVMEKGKEYGLSDKFLSTVFAAIHEASVDVQNEIISKQK